MIHWIAISTNLIFKLIIKCCIVYIIDGVSHRLFDILLLLECRPWLVRMTSSSGCSWPRTNRGYTETSCPWILSKRWGARGDWWCYTWDGYNVENEKPKFNLILILGLSSAVLSACIPYFQKFFFLYSTCISYLLAYTSVYVNCVLSQSSIILSSIL